MIQDERNENAVKLGFLQALRRFWSSSEDNLIVDYNSVDFSACLK